MPLVSAGYKDMGTLPVINVLYFVRQAIVFMVVFCISLNAMMPRFIMEYRSSSEMTQVIENQAVLFTQINSLTGIAVKIAAAFLKNPLSHAAMPFSKSKGSNTNASSEYSLISTEKRLLSHSVSCRPVSAVTSIYQTICLPVLTFTERLYLQGDVRGIYLSLLLSLFSFARSDVSDAAGAYIIANPVNPTCEGKLGFLLFDTQYIRTGELK